VSTKALKTLDCKSFGGVPIDLSFFLCKNEHMAKLDDDDLKAIKDLVEVTVDEVIEKKELVTKSDLSHLPTKDEFFNKMDDVVGELKTIREEQALISHRVSNHEDRIEKIESNLGIASD
jgi:hypothetical protein